MTGFAALFASLGLHASVLGVVVVGALNLPSQPAAASWAGSTFEVSTLAELGGVSAPGVQADAGRAAVDGVTAPELSAGASDPSPSESGEPQKAAASGELVQAHPAASSVAQEAPKTPRAQPGSERVKASEARPSETREVKRNTDSERKPYSSDEPGEPSRAQSGSSSVAQSENANAGAAPSGSFGGEGAIKRKGSLPDAFTRVLPVAAGGAAWRGLALGAPGRFVVVVSLDEEGAVARVTPLGTSRPHALELTRNLAMLLRSGRFAAPAEKGVNEYRLGVTPRIDETTPTPGGALSFQPPVGKHPGHATLVQDSGRRIEFDVEVEPDWKD